MSKIIGVTVGTPISPKKLSEKLSPVKTVNGKSPDANGNVEIVVEDGYTPVKGEDYYTPEEQAEWVAFINDELTKKGQLKLEFVNSTDEMVDPETKYVYNGTIWEWEQAEGEPQPLFENLLEKAVEADGITPYNGGKYYKEGWRLSSSGAETQETDADVCMTGYIPISGASGQTLRFKNMPQSAKSEYILYYREDFTRGDSITYESAMYAAPDDDGVYSVTLATNVYTKYIRISAGQMSEDTVITISDGPNEGKIEYSAGSSGYRFVDTGHALVPADYEDRVIDLEALAAEHAEAIAKLQEGATEDNGDSETSYITVNSISEMTDTSKQYLLNGYIYAWRATGSQIKPLFKNLLDKAVNDDGTPYNDGKGYEAGKRLNSSGVIEDVSECCITGYIEASPGQTLRMKNVSPSSKSDYLLYYREDFSRGDAIGYESDVYASLDENGVYSYTLSSADYIKYIRISSGQMSEDTIITLDDEIAYEEVAAGYDWVNTGLTPETATTEGRLTAVEQETARLNAEISGIDERLTNVESGISNLTDDEKLTLIRQWDAPIYDRAPVFLLDTEKPAVHKSNFDENDERKTKKVYDKYDALMAEHPDFIRRTDLGLCSDGKTHVYRYDFCEREPRHKTNKWSETKPKFIVVTGIHREWNGIYGMFHALSEITTNPDLAELRRNVHFIAIPVLSPYSLDGDYDVVGHCANYNGVEIHRNFEVGFEVKDEGTIHYSGPEPLSEVESQYLDNIFKENTDAAYFLTCHSFDREQTWGVGFLWGSSATNYMCNMAYRVIDKMGKAWHEKYGQTWVDGIANANSGYTALEEGDYRIGHADLTTTNGNEQRHATKYGIQATNFEVGETMFVLDSEMLSAKALTLGTEAYINFFLTAMNCYDFKDKKQYFTG